jgi:hypothetical protein
MIHVKELRWLYPLLIYYHVCAKVYSSNLSLQYLYVQKHIVTMDLTDYCIVFHLLFKLIKR